MESEDYIDKVMRQKTLMLKHGVTKENIPLKSLKLMSMHEKIFGFVPDEYVPEKMMSQL